MHDHSDQRNGFHLLYNPLVDLEKQYNTSNFVFLENYNYYLGSIITLQLKHVDNDEEADLLIRKIIAFQNMDIFTASDIYLKNESMAYINSITKEISEKQKPFVTLIENSNDFSIKIQFQNSMEQQEAMDLLSLIQDQFQQSSLFKVEHSIYILNPMTEILLKQSHVFDTSVYGRIKYDKTNDYAVYYYQDSAVQGGVVFEIVVKSIFAFVVFGQIMYTVGKRIFFMIIKFLSTRIFEFEFDLLIITAQRTLNLIYVVVWFIGFASFQDISITPDTTMEQLQQLDTYFSDFSLYQLFAIVTFIISIYDLIKIMTSFFPTFGVLLYTFTVAGNDILIFVSYTAMMLISFIIIGNIIFGPSYLELSTFMNASFFCFEFLSGQLKFTKLTSFNSTIGYIYGFIFFVIFILILLPYLYGIIIYTYGILREKMQMHTQALAEIAADKSTAATLKWINLIFFLPPKTEEQVEQERIQKELLKKQKIQKKLDEEKKKKNKKKKGQTIQTISQIDVTLVGKAKSPNVNLRSLLKNKDGITPGKGITPNKGIPPSYQVENNNDEEEQAEPEKQLTMAEIFMYNFQQLDIKNVILSFIGLGQEDLLTKQQRVEEIQKKMTEIVIRQQKQKEELKKLKEESLFTNLKDGFLHIIFLIFVIIGFSNQTIKSLTFEQESYLNSYLNSTTFQTISHFDYKSYTIDQIEGSYQLTSFLTQIVLQAATTRYENEFDTETITDYDIIVGYFPIRITFRLYEPMYINFFTKNQNLQFRGRPSNDLSPTSGQAIGEKQLNLYIHGNEYVYIPPGTEDTASRAGGYAFSFSQEISDAISKYQLISDDNFLTVSTGLINIEFVIYNPSNDMYSFTTLSLNINGNGQITNTLAISNFPITLYSGERLTRIVIELIILYFHYKFWIMFFNQWETVWNHEDASDFTPFDIPDDKSFIERYMNIDLADSKNSSIFNLLFAIAKRIYGFFMRLLTSLKLMVSQTFFNILLITGIIMMFVQIIYWLQISFTSFRMTFDFYVNLHTNLEPPGMFNSFQHLASLFKQYNTMIAFIMFNEMVRIMFYFSFSAKLSLVLDIIASASLDIIFFMIMFCLIVFAFACIGVLTFGSEYYEFQTLTRSVIKCVELFQGQSSITQIDGENYQLADILFYFLLVIILYLVFIRMLIAILDGHYQELMKDDSAGRLGLVDTIMSILKTEYDKVKKQKLEDEEAEEDEEQEEKQYSQWKIVAYFQQKVIQLKELSIKIYKYGKGKFIEYRDKLFDMLFALKSNENEENEGQNEDDNDENGLKVDLDFGEDDVAHLNKVRLETVEEIKIYNVAQQALEFLEELSGNKLNRMKFKTTQVSTWISALDKGISDVASNSLNFAQYYIPIQEKEKDWIEQFQFKDFDQTYQNIVVEMEGDVIDMKLKNDQFAKYAGVLSNKIMNYLSKSFSKDSAPSEDNNKELLRMIDQYFLFYLNIVLIHNPEQYLKKQNQKEKKKKQKKKIEIDYEISLLDVSQEIPFFMSDKTLFDINQLSMKQKSIRSKLTIQKSIKVQKEKTIVRNLHGRLKPEGVKTMNTQQMIYIFSRISDLFEIWNTLKFNDKLALWFGYDTHSQKNTMKTKLTIYHKVAFWNQSGWDKRTLQKVPKIKNDLLLEEIQEAMQASENIIEEYNFCSLWKQLYRSKETFIQKVDEADEDLGFDSRVTLPASQAQLNFVKYILRGPQNLLEQVSKLDTFEKKLNYLKNSHISNEHKIVFWILMNPMEKIQMIMEQEQKQEYQFMILLLIEELYDNFIMLQKIESDLTKRLNTKIYQMYHNFAEFNALATAVNIRQKYIQQSINDSEDYVNYIQFLENQLANSNKSLSICSDFLMQQVQTQQTKTLFQKLAKPGKKVQLNNNT